MIFIISNDYDRSTNIVIKWLIQKGEKFIRLGQKEFVESINVSIENEKFELEFTINNSVIKYSQISGFWYRKHLMNLLPQLEITIKDLPIDEKNEYLDYLHNEELKILYDYIIFMLEQKNFVGNLQAKNGNKLIYFYLASQSGLKIPKTRVSSSKTYLEEFHSKQKRIVKPIQDLFHFDSEKTIIANYNALSNDELFEGMAETIFPSCLQKYIDKKIEIRTFYLKEEMYSMAIFSQNDEKTKLDFRNYNDEKPNRMLPFKLPEKIRKKIKVFMKLAELNSGSIDLILAKDNEYYFLEVNPAGQYGMIEEACNYGLDEKIVEKLIEQKK